MTGSIYLIRNFITGKCYIGQTIQNPEDRFKQHLKLLKTNENQLISKAIRKYGEKSFEFTILESNIPEEKLNEKEIDYIQKLDTLYPNGYNLSEGGQKAKRQPVLLEKETSILKWIDEGKSLREIALILGVTHPTVKTILNRNQIQPIKRSKYKPVITEEEKSKIAQLYRDGLSTKEIAILLNRSERGVRRYRGYC
ncbi:helix-turn-helix domain-containing protein [Bacillus sp. Hm123]|uniref:GIY-YIG nuclease family protein n=1 Tax=Bacillus sp. Hm123 TaxID=3450745 RepID=UPI003F42C8E5